MKGLTRRLVERALEGEMTEEPAMPMTTFSLSSVRRSGGRRGIMRLGSDDRSTSYSQRHSRSRTWALATPWLPLQWPNVAIRVHTWTLNEERPSGLKPKGRFVFAHCDDACGGRRVTR